MEFRATKQFQEKYYNTTLQDKLSLAIWKLSQSLENRRNGNATRWPNQLKPVKGLDSKWPPMREFKISDAGRIIFTESANPVLFDFELTHTALENLKAKLSATAAKQRIAKATILKIMPEEQLPEAANLSTGGGTAGSFLFEEELFNNWVVHLDNEQAAVREQLLESVLDNPKAKLTFVFGGAGTGKSSVLATLAQNLAAFGKHPHFDVPQGVYEMLKTSDQVIPGLTKFHEVSQDTHVILLDDPYSLASVDYYWDIAKTRVVPLIVAIDPSQWHERKLGEAWAQFTKENKFDEYTLRVAYRQAKGVGEKSTKIISNFLKKSSPFADPTKILRERAPLLPLWEQTLDNLVYLNQTGDLEVLDAGWKTKDVKQILQKVQDVESLSERRWPSVLLGHNFGLSLPAEALSVVRHFKKAGLKMHQRSYDANEKVRGTEYDFALLFLDRYTWIRLQNGRTEMGTVEWTNLNKTLTFLTRARLQTWILLIE